MLFTMTYTKLFTRYSGNYSSSHSTNYYVSKLIQNDPHFTSYYTVFAFTLLNMLYRPET